MLFHDLYPDRMITSPYDLDWEDLCGKYNGAIFDIDNTLVPHGAPADDRAVELFVRLHQLGMRTMLVSNNGEERVEPFARQLGTEYVHKAGKPKKEGYQKAMERMGTGPKDTLFIGDQIFTDVWGANRAGLFTILTEPIDISTDEPQITVKRFFERPFRRARPR